MYLKSKAFQALHSLKEKGFFNIFSATIINSVISFVYGIFIVRLLSQNEYGTFTYVQNIINFGVLFCSMGVNLGVLQFCSENTEIQNKYQYSRFAAVFGSICSVVVTVIMILYTRVDGSNTARLTFYTIEFSFMPILYFAKDWIVSNLRWQLRNREYANVMNVHSVTNALFAIMGAWLAGIDGVIFGICLSYLSAVLLGLYYIKQDLLPSVRTAKALEKVQIGRFLKYSVTMCVVNVLISVLFTVDIFVIGNVMKDSAEIAMYKTACLIPFALNMIPNSIMTFVYPHVAAHRDDRNWLKMYMKRLYAANFCINFLIGVCLYFAAPLLIAILFGNRYEGILPVFRILVISYIVSSSLRTPSANLFGILRQEKTALAVSVGTAILNICLSITLVTRFGIMGAAYSSVTTFGTVGILSTGLLVYRVYFKRNEERK